MQIHAERRGSRLIVGLEGKEEGRGGGEIAVGKEREESFFAVSSFFSRWISLHQRGSWNFYPFPGGRLQRKREEESRKRGKMKGKRCDIWYSLDPTGIFKVRLLFSSFFFFYIYIYNITRDSRQKKADANRRMNYIRFNPGHRFLLLCLDDKSTDG